MAWKERGWGFMGILQPQVIVLGNTAVHTGPGNFITSLASVQR